MRKKTVRAGRRISGGYLFLGLMLAALLLLTFFAAQTQFLAVVRKPGWKPPKCRNPDDFVEVHIKSKKFEHLGAVIEVLDVKPGKLWYKNEVTDQETKVKIKYHIPSNIYQVCWLSTFEWVIRCEEFASRDEADRYFDSKEENPDIEVVMLKRYLIVKVGGIQLKGSGTKEVPFGKTELKAMIKIKPIDHVFVKGSRKLYDEGLAKVKDPVTGEWKPYWSIKHNLLPWEPKFHGLTRTEEKVLVNVVIRVPHLKDYTLIQNRGSFKEIFGKDPLGERVDLCDLIRYEAGDWPAPQIKIEPVGTPQLNQDNKFKIVFRNRYGQPFTLRGLKTVKLIMWGPAKSKAFLEQRRAYKQIQTDVVVDGGEVVKTLPAKYFKYPGYYLLRVERDWGGYIAYDELYVKIGEFKEPVPKMPEMFEIANAEADLSGTKYGWEKITARWKATVTVKPKPEAKSDYKWRLVMKAYLPTLADPMTWKKPIASKTFEGTASEGPKTLQWSDSHVMRGDVRKISKLHLIATLYQWDVNREEWVSIQAKQWQVDLKTGHKAVKDIEPANTEPGSPDMSAGVGGDKPVKSGGVNIGVSASGEGHVEIDWGDGTKTIHPVNKGSQTFTHYYSEPGDYKVKAEVYDADGDPVNGKEFEFTVESPSPWQRIVEFFQGILEWFLGLFGLR